MKKKLILIPSLSLSVLAPAITLSSCANSNPDKYVAIPTIHFNLEDDGKTLNGFKATSLTLNLDGYNTLQIPSTVESVRGFNYRTTSVAYNYINNVIYSSSSKWTTIPSNAFSSLPNLTKIVLPSTLTNIGDKAFFQLKALKTIDISNMTKVNNIIRSESFVLEDTDAGVLNGTIIVKNSDIEKQIKEIFKNNDWLKGWSIKVK